MTTQTDTPSKAAKRAGLYSLSEAAQASGVPYRTLENWFAKKRWVFEAVIEKSARELGRR